MAEIIDVCFNTRRNDYRCQLVSSPLEIILTTNCGLDSHKSRMYIINIITAGNRDVMC
jgi:hypothetical protein